MVIDAHVHLYPPETNADPAGWANARGEKHWAVLATRVRKNGRPVQSFPALKELLTAMDEAGVDRAVLQGWYWENAESCAAQNAFYAECLRRHPDRVAAAVTVQPRAGTSRMRVELARARDAGFQGIGELSPHSQGYPIDDAAFEELLGTAGEWRWPVTLHVTAPDAKPYPGLVPTPLADFEALARRFPKTDFILAHFGGVENGMVERVAPNPLSGPDRVQARTRSETEAGWGLSGVGLAKTEQLAPPNVYFDSAAGPLSYGPEIWQRFEPGRVLFGSDFPLNLYPALDPAPNLRRFVDAVRSGSGLPPAELAAVLGGTAKRWFAAKAAI